jgi:hypothetical protein
MAAVDRRAWLMADGFAGSRKSHATKRGVGPSVDEPVWDATVFCKNRDRLLDGDIAAEFMAAVLNLPDVKRLLSSDHFSVDGTLIQTWASMKSLRRKDGTDQPLGPGRNAERDFHKDRRANETHASTTDPDARLAKQAAGKEAKLAYVGHLLTENHHGLVVDARLTHATGMAEPEATLEMLDAVPGSHRITAAADKAYDTADFVVRLRQMNVTRQWHRASPGIATGVAFDVIAVMPRRPSMIRLPRAMTRTINAGVEQEAGQGLLGGALFIVECDLGERDPSIAIDDKARLYGIDPGFGAPEGQKVPTKRTLDQPCIFGRPANAILNGQIARSVLEHREARVHDRAGGRYPVRAAVKSPGRSYPAHSLHQSAERSFSDPSGNRGTTGRDRR